MANPLKKAAKLQYEDDERESLWKRLGNTALSGVAAAGNLLDTLPSMARDVVGLENPFDNLLHPFSGDNRLSGRDLLRKYGLVGQEDTWANWGAGLATEIASGFATPLPGSLLTGASKAAGGGAKGLLKFTAPGLKGTELFTGNAAQTAAAAIKEVPDLLTKPSKLAPKIDSWLPYKQGADTLKASASVAEQAAKSPASELAYNIADVATTPGRTLQGLFGKASGGKFMEHGQDLAAMQHAHIPEAVKRAKDTVTDWADDLGEIHKAFSDTYGADLLKTLPKPLAAKAGNVEHHLKNKFESWINHAAETDIGDAFSQLGLDASKLHPDITRKTDSLIGAMKSANRERYNAYLEMGGQGKVMEDLEAAAEGVSMGHMPRASEYSFNSMGQYLRSFFTKPSHAMSRAEEVRYVPKLVLEQLAHDDIVRTAKPEDAIKHIVEKHGKYLNQELVDAVDKQGKAIKVPKWETPEKHAEALMNWAKGRAPYQVYQNDILGVEGRYHNAVNIATSNIAAMHDMVQKHMGPMAKEYVLGENNKPLLKGLRDFTEATRGQKLIDLPAMYSGAGMDVEKSLRYLARKMGHKESELADPKKWAALRDHFNLVGVPEDVAGALHAARKVQNNPEWLEHIAQLSDIATSHFKQNVTLPFASFASRNLLSGQYMNAAGGDIKSLDELKAYGQHVKDWWESYRHGKIAPEKEREWFTNGVLSGDTHFEGVQFRNPEFGKVVPENPLAVKTTWQQAGEDILPSGLDRVPGLRTLRQTHGAMLGSGAKVNGVVEYLNRVPMYEYLKGKGMSPEDAARRVLELQVDYSPHSFSPFENTAMRRLLPFYSYQRKVAPVIFKTLATNPTGVMGQTIRLSRLAGSDDPTTPDWIGNTLAIPSPLGSKEEGGQAYITGLGLPYEAPLGYLGGGLRGAGRQFLSQLNPLVKAPLEWSTGQSFFQTSASGTGRPLDELNPPIGQTLANIGSYFGGDASEPVRLPTFLEFAAANSPASRFISTARQLSDPRKGLLDKAANTLTGLRVADVSPAAADTALFGRVSNLLKQSGGRTFSESYVPRERLAGMSDTQRALVEQLMSLKKEIEQRRKQRKAAA